MNVLGLPSNLQLHCFSYLDIPDLVLGVRQTCWLWHNLSYDSQLWRHLRLGIMDFGENLASEDFLDLLASVQNHVETITFGLALRLTDHAFLHEGIFCPCLKSLDFSMTRVRSQSILELVEKYPRLEELILNECTYVDMIGTLRGIATLSNLKSIALDDFGEDPDNSASFNECMKELFTRCKSLEKVVLKCELLNDEALSSLFLSCERLQHLVLESCIGISLGSFLPDATLAQHLITLILVGLPLDDHELLCILRRCPRLGTLELLECPNLTDIGFKYIADYCHGLRCLSVSESIDEDGSKLSSAGLVALSQNCPLETLILSLSCRVDDSGITAVAMNCPKLQTFTLYGCGSMTDASLIALAENCPLLRHIDIHQNFRITSESVNVLLQKCKYLKFLNMEYMPMLKQLVFNPNTCSAPLCVQNCDEERMPVEDVESPQSLAQKYVREVISQSQKVQSLFLTKHCTSAVDDSCGCREDSLELSYAAIPDGDQCLSEDVCEVGHVPTATGQSVSNGQQGVPASSTACSDPQPSPLMVQSNLLPQSSSATEVKVDMDMWSNQQSDLEASPGVTQRVQLEEEGSPSLMPSDDLLPTRFWHHCHISTLLLSFCPRLEDASLFQIAAFCPDLRRFSVRGCTKISDRGIMQLVEGCQNLRQLDISNMANSMQLTDLSLRAVANHCLKLEQLECSGNSQFTLASFREIFLRCQALLYVGLTVGRPTAISFMELQQVVANIPSRRLSIISAKSVEENGHRGNLFIKFCSIRHQR